MLAACHPPPLSEVVRYLCTTIIVENNLLDVHIMSPHIEISHSWTLQGKRELKYSRRNSNASVLSHLAELGSLRHRQDPGKLMRYNPVAEMAYVWAM